MFFLLEHADEQVNEFSWGFYVPQWSFELRDVFFWTRLQSLWLLFFQFYPVLVLREVTLCSLLVLKVFVILVVVLYQVLSFVLLFWMVLVKSL